MVLKYSKKNCLAELPLLFTRPRKQGATNWQRRQASVLLAYFSCPSHCVFAVNQDTWLHFILWQWTNSQDHFETYRRPPSPFIIWSRRVHVHARIVCGFTERIQRERLREDYWRGISPINYPIGHYLWGMFVEQIVLWQIRNSEGFDRSSKHHQRMVIQRRWRSLKAGAHSCAAQV